MFFENMFLERNIRKYEYFENRTLFFQRSIDKSIVDIQLFKFLKYNFIPIF